ncbi:MAG: hypothetical protein WCG76_08195, partial [Verrucomicrobiota bacterium]
MQVHLPLGVFALVAGLKEIRDLFVGRSHSLEKFADLLAGLERVELEVAGIVPGLRGNVGLTDLATAQWRLKRLGNLNRIDLRLVPGADAAR